jgi:choline dehydrogenase-like flavoprotein
MGSVTDPDAVVDSHQEVRGTNGLYVAGTADWPTSLAPFPILTIEALAARLANDILRDTSPPGGP